MKLIRTLFLAAIALLIINTVRAEEFKKGEFNIDAGYMLSTETFGDYVGSTYLGANYLLTKNAGLHIGATGADEFHGTFVERVEFGLLGRLPFKSIALDFGIGSSFGLKRDDWEVYAEAGPRFRVTKHIDLFAKVRGSTPVSSSESRRVDIIGGVGVDF